MDIGQLHKLGCRPAIQRPEKHQNRATPLQAYTPIYDAAQYPFISLNNLTTAHKPNTIFQTRLHEN
jgi:hypothetical protein